MEDENEIYIRLGPLYTLVLVWAFCIFKDLDDILVFPRYYPIVGLQKNSPSVARVPESRICSSIKQEGGGLSVYVPGSPVEGGLVAEPLSKEVEIVRSF